MINAYANFAQKCCENFISQENLDNLNKMMNKSIEAFVAMNQVVMQNLASAVNRNTEFAKKQIQRSNECATSQDRAHTCSSHIMGFWQDCSGAVKDAMEVNTKLHKDLFEAYSNKMNMATDGFEKANKQK